MIQLPLIVLGYSSKKLLAMDDADGRVRFPVFTDADLAQDYLRWQNSHLWLPGSPRLYPFVIEELSKARDILQLVSIAGKVTLFAINPRRPGDMGDVERCLCYELDELLEMLSDSSGDDSSGEFAGGDSSGTT